MKIKKRELRKSLPQLPINYPAPTVQDVFNYDSLKHRVEDICKKLSHVEVVVRDAALDALPLYLKEVSESYISTHKADDANAPTAEDLELLLQKLALGIFFCFWHSDKPLVQHECAYKISRLVHCPLSFETQAMFIEAIFGILARNWGKIDHYRIDKYMAMVRKLFFQTLLAIKESYTGEYKKDRNNTENMEEVFGDVFKYPSFEGTTGSVLDKYMINRVISFFQNKIIFEPNCVGLTMHLMDISLDEFIRSDLPVDIFVHLAKHIPLFAMSKGNFIEKRILDFFIMPMCAGVLDERHVSTLGTSPETLKEQESKQNKSSKYSKKVVETATPRDYSKENDQICFQMLEVCRWYSVRKSTKFLVRPMFIEAEKLFKQRLEIKLNPAVFKRLSKKELHRRIAQDIAEVELTKEATLQYKKELRRENLKDKEKAKQLLEEMDIDGEYEDDNDDIVEKEGKTDKMEKKKRRVEQDLKKMESLPTNIIAAPVKDKKGLENTRKKTGNLSTTSPRVVKELRKLLKKNKIKKEKETRLTQGERSSKISIAGVRKNSKRNKVLRLTKEEIRKIGAEE